MPCAAPVMIATLPANRREPPAPPEPAPPVPSLVLDICPDYSSAHDRTQGLLGEFDPDFRYEDLSKEALVRLVREFALIAQLLDRSVFAAIGLRYGQRTVEELAIEEWRGASPIYTDRIRKIMKIEGNGVPAIFKQLQLDPGFAQHYMDVEYEVVDENHGFFQLRSCGALLDVEPWGERPVRGMCHTIED